jgi:D-glycero-D-manno-heptose 1,7-bisphosphate phosphatase
LRVRHVILDRDGVLNVEDPGGGYVLSPEAFVWIDGALQAIEAIRNAGAHLSVATNQSAVGRGLLDRDTLESIHDRIRSEAGIEDIYVCPHVPDEGCDCRKPAPGLLYQAIEASGIEARQTMFVGDAQRDIDAARAAGVEPVLLRTGKGRKTEAALSVPTQIYDDLPALVRSLLADR